MLIVAVFVLTYLGMAVGRIPGLKVDRTGIAVMAVALLLASGAVAPERAAAGLDGATLALMFGLMILSAQFGEAGLYGAASRRIVAAADSPDRLLALTVLIGGGLSMVLVNDIVVFAMAPILCAGLRAHGRDPRPYLVALAGAGNAGSAATLIGNPQNILIGQLGHLDFWRFVAVCGPPALAGLVCVYVAVRATWRRELAAAASTAAADEKAPIDRRQLAKGVLATAVLIALSATPVPREVAALAVAGLLLASRRIHSRAMIAAVDWHLLLLIAGLFVVTSAFAGELAAQAGWFAALPPPERLSLLAPGALVLSNTIGNVPATILLLSLWPHLAPGTLYGLAVLSTLAGNLLLVGSLCNIIVAERAAASGVALSFADFARAGIPMTLASMVLAAAWLAAGGWMTF
jgi:Na+/H+ antiporter NhaD/arsenite permease-like protein